MRVDEVENAVKRVVQEVPYDADMATKGAPFQRYIYVTYLVWDEAEFRYVETIAFCPWARTTADVWKCHEPPFIIVKSVRDNT